ncbi:MAG: flippase-like domain-containing protein [Actinobacteria bacterium]|nr:flippase-like domain-containing protein [Actinomycetota bacterium]
MGVVRYIRGSGRARVVLRALSASVALTIAVLVARHFARSGWPLAGADPRLVVATAFLFLAAYAFKAFGWQRLIAPAERPGSLGLAAASGAACVAGAALPGRVDDAVRIAFLRRVPGCRAGVGTLCFSLLMLGLIDTIALTPFASAAAASGDLPLALRIGLAVVAFAGFGAAAVVLVLPRVSGSRLLTRFRLGRWLAPRATSAREARRAVVLIALSWLVRAAGLCLLLSAVGIGLSLPLALVFLSATAASGALPIAPAGAATQAGAGAAVLAASGISTTEAIAFAVAAQALAIAVGAVVVLLAAAWFGSRRLGLLRAFPA